MKETIMKQSIRQLNIGLALFVVIFAYEGWSQSSPQQVAGSGWQALTKTSPAVAIGSNQTEYVAWKGANSSSIYFSAFNGSAWTTQQAVGGGTYPHLWSAETTAAPSLFYNGSLWLAWQAKTGSAVKFSGWNGASWSEPQEVSGTGWTAETTKAPTFDPVSFSAMMAWKRASTTTIWYSQNEILAGGWQGQNSVGGSGWNAETNVAPSLEGDTNNNVPVLYWKGATGNHIWTSTGTYCCGEIIIDGWTQQTEISCSSPKWAAETSASPAASGYWGPDANAPVPWDVVVWKGASSTSLWYTYDRVGGCGWAQQEPLIGSGWSMDAATNVAPALAFACPACDENTSTVAILAWKNATDNTDWFLNPTTLPGLSSLTPEHEDNP
jgi:hypothetical protein